MGVFLVTNLTLNMGGEACLGKNLMHNMWAFLGKNSTLNMGAFLGKNLTYNMGAFLVQI